MSRQSKMVLVNVGLWSLLLIGIPMWIFWTLYAVFTLYLIFSYIRWRFLPTATLEVDGKTVEYRYQRKTWGDLASFAGESHSYSPSYFLLSKAPIDQPLALVGLDVIQTETTVFEATFTLEGESYDLLMKGGYGRCPCWRETPCWTGQVYVSNFVWSRDDHHLGGQIVFVDKGKGPKRKRRKLKFKKLKLPAWKLFPDPSPHPS